MRHLHTYFSRALTEGRLRSISDISEASRISRRSGDAEDTSFQRFMGEFEAIDDTPLRASQRLAFPSLMTDEISLTLHCTANWINLRYAFMFGVASFIEAARKRDIPLYVSIAFDPSLPSHADASAVRIEHRPFGDALSPGEHTFLRSLCERVSFSKGIPLAYSSGVITDPSGPVFGPLLSGELHKTPRAILRAGA